MELSYGENALNKDCFICGGTRFEQNNIYYRRCISCGHEVLVGSDTQGYILNDYLSKSESEKVTQLDRYKQKTLFYFDPKPQENSHWVDIGSSSGKYLYQNQQHYGEVYGLEITSEALIFAREVYGMNVFDDVTLLPKRIDVVTAWHSLEHFPAKKLKLVLDSLASRMDIGAKFIISVPNSLSRQYRWFSESYAFFDVPNHLHQFSPQSLDILMNSFGFLQVAYISSGPYNSFGYIQGMLNLLTGSHNYLYYRLKRKSCSSNLWLDIIHPALLLVLVPLGWLMGIVDSFNLKNQGVITVCYKKTL